MNELNDNLNIGESKPYIYQMGTTEVQDLQTYAIHRQIHEMTSDLREISESYDHEMNSIRGMMKDREPEFAQYLHKHEAMFTIAMDTMSWIDKERSGNDNFERLGFGLATMQFEVSEQKSRDMSNEPEQEVEQEKRISLTEIMALSDNDKRERGYPVFSNVDVEKHEKIFDERVIVETAKYEREQKQLKQEVDRSL